jgi:hypothetical protein
LLHVRRSLFAVLLALGGAAACSIFPDQLVLPDLGAAGEGGSLAGSAAGDGGDEPGAGEASQMGGAGGRAGAGGAEGGAPPSNDGGVSGSGDQAGAGAAGQGGGCAESHTETLAPNADTWIDQKSPDENHGSKNRLRLSPEPQAERVLLRFDIASLRQAGTPLRVTLHLTSDATEALAGARSLSVHALSAEFVESVANWVRWGQGSPRRWTQPGGDFAPFAALASVEADLPVAAVVDVTELYAQLEPGSDAFSVIVLDVSADLPSASELFFASREAPTELRPRLELEYCAP